MTSTTSASITTVGDSTSSQTLASFNANRRELIITNDSTAILYVKFGATASTTDYSLQLAANDTLITEYQSRIDGVWASDVGGSARITELS